MNYNDSPHEIITDVHLKNNGVLHRFNNPAGVPYSAIYVGNHEEASCERYREPGMIRWWNGPQSDDPDDLRRINEGALHAMLWLMQIRERTEDGIIPFSTATGKEPGNPIYYDDKHPIDRGEDLSYNLVCDKLIDHEHHDIIDTWDGWMFGAKENPQILVDKEDGSIEFCWNFETFYVEIIDGEMYVGNIG